MATTVTCIIEDSGTVKVNFEGDHLRKALLNRVVKAIKHYHRRDIINYRQNLRAVVSKEAADSRIKQEEAENLGVISNANIESGSKPESKPESRTNSVGAESPGITTPSRRKQEREGGKPGGGRASSGRKEAVRIATAKAGIKSGV